MQTYLNLKNKARRWVLGRLWSCREIVRLVSDSYERRLTFRERLRLRLHRLVCAWCARYVIQLEEVRQVISQDENGAAPHLTSLTLSPEARNRIASTLRNKNSSA